MSRGRGGEAWLQRAATVQYVLDGKEEEEGENCKWLPSSSFFLSRSTHGFLPPSLLPQRPSRQEGRKGALQFLENGRKRAIVWEEEEKKS